MEAPSPYGNHHVPHNCCGEVLDGSEAPREFVSAPLCSVPMSVHGGGGQPLHAAAPVARAYSALVGNQYAPLDEERHRRGAPQPQAYPFQRCQQQLATATLNLTFEPQGACESQYQVSSPTTPSSAKRGPGDEDDNESDIENGNRKPTILRKRIKIQYIEDKSRRHITFSKRKAGIMKKAFELSTLTGTEVLLLVVSETGVVYTFSTPKLQPIVTEAEGKNLIQSCLSAPDPPLTAPEDTDISSPIPYPDPLLAAEASVSYTDAVDRPLSVRCHYTQQQIHSHRPPVHFDSSQQYLQDSPVTPTHADHYPVHRC